MIRLYPAAASACALVLFTTALPLAAESRPARGGHLLGPDMPAAAAPLAQASARPARGGHVLGRDMAAARVPIRPRAEAAAQSGAPAGDRGAAPEKLAEEE